MSNHTFTEGDFVKYRQNAGIVGSTVGYGGRVLVYMHNGMKIRSNSVEPEKLTKISRDDFLEFVRKKGHTAFYDRIPKETTSK